ELESGTGLADLRVTSAEFKAGPTVLRGSGSLRGENGVWRVGLDAKGQIAGVGSDPAVAIDSIQSGIVLDSLAGEVRIASFSLRGPLIAVDMTGLVQKRGESPYQQFWIRATDSDARAALAIWPEWTAPHLHVDCAPSA
ncbi:hypothetical protein AB4156_43635, partial [Cupriavidus sp. 2MCAB6]|uniref:hypothetical protein n=1 Tax=Cupriavidus sp. 2MCAB6 TaxID=3232981 RepID=UPI003F909EC9